MCPIRRILRDSEAMATGGIRVRSTYPVSRSIERIGMNCFTSGSWINVLHYLLAETGFNYCGVIANGMPQSIPRVKCGS